MDDTAKTRTEGEPKGIIPGKALDLAAYGTAIAVGATQARSAINEAIYEQHKEFDEIQTLRKLRDADGIKKAQESVSVPHKSAEELRKIQKAYEEDVAGVLAKRYGLKGTRDYWTALTDTNRNKVIFERVLTPAGIVLGALLTLANISSIRKVFSGPDKSGENSR